MTSEAVIERRAIKKVLIANRGEIAVRIARTCRAMGLETVAVYSDADRSAVHVQVADEAAPIGPASPIESYLCIDAILDAAKQTGADAIHPGYGFLSENASFARRARDAGLVFVGPSEAAIAAMGDKLVSRAHAADAGVPVVPGAEISTAEESAQVAARIGYPLLVKAAAGGGGKGMRIVREPDALSDALAAGGREATQAFGDGRVYLERYLDRPRHVEVQVLGDEHGSCVHLGERECSIQRRHQKIIEETPACRLSPETRAKMTEAAVTLARSVDYFSAGTVEFLLDENGSFYFLEMNTRLQVEHPVTEWVTGIDLVAEQLRIAAGERLGYSQSDVRMRGASIECRIYAEDPARGFLPSAGRILGVREPGGPGVRLDSAMAAGGWVPVEYDPLLAKLTTWGPTRDSALARMRSALRDLVVLGPTTNVTFLGNVMRHAGFAAGDTHTRFVEEHFSSWPSDEPGDEEARDVAAIVAALLLAHGASGQSDGRTDSRLPSPWATLGAWRLTDAVEKGSGRDQGGA